MTRAKLRALMPVLGSLDEPTEAPSAYAARVQQVLPHFPHEVIAQWFRDHHQVIEKHAGLDYPSLRFRLESFGANELALSCLAEHPTVVQYRDYFIQGVKSRKMASLAEYILAHNTWPVAPMIFDNPDGRFVASWGLKYSVPYDLLEGHHRMAVLYGLGKHRYGSHKVWLVQRTA